MTTRIVTHPALTVFAGQAGDRNDRAVAGAAAIAAELARRLALEPTVIGNPEPAFDGPWDAHLAAPRPALHAMAARYEAIYSAGQVPVTAIARCAVALSTLPVVARHHPDAVVLWFDAHADLNTPENTGTGYLGGLALAGAIGLWDSGLGGNLHSEAVVLGGTRDLDPPEQRLIDDGVIALAAVGPDLIAEVRRAVGDRPVYVHLDCDVLEPGIVPTEYQVPGGLTLDDLRSLAELLAANEVVGIEIGEFETAFEPDGDPCSPAALLDALAPLIDAAGAGRAG
ncbi:arginase family protein [Pengzhenrongella sp.]|jgi:arginase family enzyme|uniref:arginase family protein n=1 Tax=Pengzhenrongella sp. TaxID=2888820 RepID=UPI002F955FAC